MLIKELGSTRGLRVGIIGPLFICAWRESATLADLTFLDGLQSDLVPRLGNFSMITLVNVRNAGLAGPGVREKAAEMARRFDGALVASAIVLSDEGVVAAITRAFLTAHQLLFRQRAPIRICRSIEDACQHVRTAPRQSRILTEMFDLPAAVRAFENGSSPHFIHAPHQG